MRNHEVTKIQPLLKDDGSLREPGWSKQILQVYDRNAIKAPKFRIKEWDYYLVISEKNNFGVAFTISDDGYIGLQSVSLLDFPAVKSLDFGAGYASAYLRGSQCNDGFTIQDGNVKTLTNHAGGILGGITNGMPVLFQVAVKPTPSISQPQKSISLIKGEDQELVVRGRHDPCIVPRAVPVVEAAAAVAFYDLILSNTQTRRRK